MKKRIRTHTNPLNIRQRLDDVNLSMMAKGYSFLDVEIGFGRGQFLSQYAKNHPRRFVVGVEVRRQMVEIFKSRYQLANCFPIWGAGAICLEDAIPDHQVHRIFVFHPDPWFKKRHHKRRVFNIDLLKLMEQKLVPGGVVYVSTDVEDLYNDMRGLCKTYGNLEFIENEPFWGTDYATHWSKFSNLDNRSQFFMSFKFKEET